MLAISALSFISTSVTAQTGFSLMTGPTSFTGAGNLEDGIQVASTGAYSNQFSLHTAIKPFMTAEAQLNWGSLGLTAAERSHEIAQWSGIGAGLRVHPEFNIEKAVQPWLGIGLNFMQQSNFADYTNASGEEYYYWSNGQTYDMPEDHPLANVSANPVAPDYAFETKTNEVRSLALPVQMGLNLNLTSRFYANASVGVLVGPESSLDPRPGYTDFLTTAQAGFGIRLGKAYAEPRIDYPEEWLELGDDGDSDGIKDSKDRCPGTPMGAPIDKRGCPVDSDKDGVADYLDQEPFSLHRRVNQQGIALSEEQWAALIAQSASQKGSMEELFQRVESEDPRSMVTPVDANGRTPAELRLLKAFGSNHSTIQVKSVKESATPPATTQGQNNSEFISPKPTIGSKSETSLHQEFDGDAELNQYRSIMPVIRPSYRVQLAEHVRDLDMDAVTPFLVSGQVTQKFDNSSALCIVSKAYLDKKSAEKTLQELQSAGFGNAFLVGEFNGRMISIEAATSLQETWNELSSISVVK